MSAPSPFSDGMLDALRELMNIGIGRAARAIAELTQRDVDLRVIEVEVVELGSPIYAADLQGTGSLRVSQAFHGPLSGHALLVLNHSGSIRLAQMLLGKTEDDETFDELEQSALLELGNIVIGAIMAILAGELGVTVRYEVPELRFRAVDGLDDLFADLTNPAQMRVLIMRASLAQEGSRVNGFIILLFPEPGFKVLADGVSRLATQ